VPFPRAFPTLDAALRINTPGYFLTHAIKTAAFGQLGQHEDAQNSLRELLALRPNFASTARQDYAKWFEPEMVEHLIDGLRKAGLEIAGVQSSAPPSPRPGQDCKTPSLGSGRS
jgi:hypothetical protein